MTTNVFDVQAAIVASDSRWSYTLKDGEIIRAVVYADDTGFDKMVAGQGTCALFAGRSNLIDAWKEYIKSSHKIVLRRPDTEDKFAMCVINSANGSIIFEHGQEHREEKEYRFAGTGATWARNCWLSNHDALRAVDSASNKDKYSGGEIKYFKIKIQDHNLNFSGVYSSINKAITQRGRVMYTAYDLKEVSIQDAAKTDVKVQTLLRDIASGNASAEAPIGQKKVIWTDADNKRLDDSLEAFFGPIAR